MDTPIIHVDKLSKQYRLGGIGAGSLREEIRGRWNRLRGVQPQDSETNILHALRDVSFNVHAGEILGVIGRNGAGKSTLLKILSRITEPTSGEAVLHGRVASLLEVGTGFHPELSGRENVFLSGAILGMTKAEIRQKFDDIVSFASIEKFIDTPVKRYSSGMAVRLGFAIAAHLEPEILIIDEVLAVGDFQFQKKCLGKMESVGRQGRTIIFVSHNLGMVRQLCTRCILMENGRLKLDGDTAEAIHGYYGSAAQKESYVYLEQERPSHPFIREIKILQGNKPPEGGVKSSLPLSICFDIANIDPAEDLVTSLEIRDEDGYLIFHSGTDYNASRRLDGARRECILPAGSLNAGDYTVDAFLHQKDGVMYSSLYGRLSFSAYLDDCESIHSKWKGITGPSLPTWRNIA